VWIPASPPQAAGQLQTCSSLGCQQALGPSSLPPSLPPSFLPPLHAPPTLPLVRGALGRKRAVSGCLILEAIQQQPARWPSGPGCRGEPGTWSDGCTPLPQAQRLPWKFSSSFDSAVTAPMVTQAPLRGRWCVLSPLGAGWSRLKCGQQDAGAAGEGGWASG
jgi:hypothetical protein